MTKIQSASGGQTFWSFVIVIWNLNLAQQLFSYFISKLQTILPINDNFLFRAPNRYRMMMGLMIFYSDQHKFYAGITISKKNS